MIGTRYLSCILVFKINQIEYCPTLVVFVNVGVSASTIFACTLLYQFLAQVFEVSNPLLKQTNYFLLIHFQGIHAEGREKNTDAACHD